MAAAEPTTMLAAQYTANGDDIASLVDLVRVPIPSPGPGQVLVKVEYAAANPIDVMVLGGNLKGAGWAMPFPFTVGYDLAGTVVGDTADFRDGQRVFALNWGEHKHDSDGDPVGGAFAEYSVIPASKLTAIPDGLGAREAAPLALVGLTAYQLVFDCAKVTSGSKVLVLGGSSSVGMLAVQLAKQGGAALVATTASTRNMDMVAELGADKVINYVEKDWAADEALGALDAVIDTVGEKDGFAKAKGLLKEDGAFVTIANFDPGFDPAAHPPLSFAAYYCVRNDARQQAELAQRVADGSLKQIIEEEFPFTKDGVVAMLTKQIGGKSKGKNVLKVA